MALTWGQVALLYYSLCHNNNTFRAWSSLFRKHAPSKILMNQHNASILWAWTSFFHKHTPACYHSAQFLPASPFIPTSLFINTGDFCQPPRLLFWPKFASLPPSIWNSRIWDDTFMTSKKKTNFITPLHPSHPPPPSPTPISANMND